MDLIQVLLVKKEHLSRSVYFSVLWLKSKLITSTDYQWKISYHVKNEFMNRESLFKGRKVVSIGHPWKHLLYSPLCVSWNCLEALSGNTLADHQNIQDFCTNKQFSKQFVGFFHVQNLENGNTVIPVTQWLQKWHLSSLSPLDTGII